jgi:hypothetical protein
MTTSAIPTTVFSRFMMRSSGLTCLQYSTLKLVCGQVYGTLLCLRSLKDTMQPRVRVNAKKENPSEEGLKLTSNATFRRWSARLLELDGPDEIRKGIRPADAFGVAGEV